MHLEDCAHGGLLDPEDPRCRDCVEREDCTWLLSADEKTDLESLPLNQLVSALGFALESVQSLLQNKDHDELCHCEVCLWHKQADILYSEARCHPDLGPPPMPH